MKAISNIDFLTSGICNEYSSIRSIDIDDNPFASGGFGVVYHCISINGVSPSTQQVIKILFDSNENSHKGYLTIQSLQKKILNEVNLLNNSGKKFVDEYPALIGCPQFSFSGILDGKKVLGYSANNLKLLGFDDFEEVLTDESKRRLYQNLSLIDKLSIAYKLAQSFELLRKFLYIHADFKSEALFINIKKLQCAIIDFDSGAVMQSDKDKPTTWGTPQDWLAPEIIEQFATGHMSRKKADDLIPVKVDLYSDMWSVAICIHYLIFTFHPFCFFTEISPRSINEFSKAKTTFPDLPVGFIFFNPKRLSLYNEFYKPYFNKNLPLEVRNKLSNAFSLGCTNPQSRVSYSQWKLVLRSTQKPPKIISLSADLYKVDTKKPVSISWQVENASSIYLNDIDVSEFKSYLLQINRDSIITLTAKNAIDSISKDVKIEVSKDKPIIKEFKSNLVQNYVQSNTTIILSWVVDGFEQLEINNGIGDVSKIQNIQIEAPRKDTTFELKATSYFGQVSIMHINFTVNKASPTIHYFSASKITLLDKNDSVILSWNINNASIIDIDQGIGDVTSKKSISINPRQETTYTIKATSYFGVVSTKQLTISVSKIPPKINSFLASKQLVTTVEEVTLYWDIENAEKIIIDNGIGEVTNYKSINFKVTDDTALTITAISYFGAQSTCTLTIQTLKIPPIIKEFSSDRNIVEDKHPITLNWQVENAKQIFIDNEIGEVTYIRSKSIQIQQDSTFTLKAVSSFGVASYRTVKIQISKTPPQITSFRVESPLLAEGLSTFLIWQTTAAFSVVIDNGIGAVGASGKVAISPTTDKTYTIVAKNYFGYESRAHVYLKIIKKPKLNNESIQLKSIPKLKKDIQ